MSTQIDHKELAESRLATQFKQSTKLINYIRALLCEANTLEQVFIDLIEQRWIETAEGTNLDIIGSIVGQNRSFVDAEVFDYFGFADHPQAQSFGSLLDVGLGGRFRRVGEAITGFRDLNDEEYRKFIRARIVRNSTKSTPENIISQLRFIFDSPLVILSDGNTSYQISIGRKLTLNEKSILIDTDIVPKTAGASAHYISEFEGSNFFGFKGIPGSDGFGSINNSALGGKLGNLIF